MWYMEFVSAMQEWWLENALTGTIGIWMGCRGDMRGEIRTRFEIRGDIRRTTQSPANEISSRSQRELPAVFQSGWEVCAAAAFSRTERRVHSGKLFGVILPDWKLKRAQGRLSIYPGS